jgi:hypothetical protein
MAEGDDTVLQEFIADMAPYIDAIEEAVHDARDFADANLEAKAAVDSMRDSAAEAGLALDDVTANELEAAEAAGRLRDETLEAGEALGHERDEAAEAAIATGALADSEDAAAASSEGMALGLGQILLILAPLLATLAIALTPFLVNLALGAAAVAGFAALAVPDLEKVWKAVEAGGKAWRDLSPEQKRVGDDMKSLKTDFDHLSKAIQPEILQAFATGMRILKMLMPDVRALLVAAAHGVDSFLKQVQAWLSSPAGQKFIEWLKKDAPEAAETFFKTLWDIISIFGRVVSFMYHEGETMDRQWKENIHGMAVALDDLREWLVQSGEDVGQWSRDIAHWTSIALDIFRENLVGSGHNVEAWADDVGRYTMDVVHFFERLPGEVGSALSALPHLLYSIGVAAVDGLLHGVESAAGGLIGYVEHLASDISGAFAKVLSIFSPSKVFHQHGLMIMAGLAQGITAGYPMAAAAIAAAAAHLAGSRTGLTGAALAGPLGGAPATTSSGGGVVMTVNVTVNGSVIAQQQLKSVIQEAMLDAWTRTGATGFVPYGHTIR